VRLAEHKVLVLLNNDLLFEPGWLEPMLAILLAPELNAGIVGNIQFRVADGSVDHAGVYLTSAGQLEHIKTIPNEPHSQAFAVTGACVVLYKSDFDAVGGFDEDYINGCEDIDLCFKLSSFGKKAYVANQSRIRHHVSLSREVNNQRDSKNNFKLFSRWHNDIKQELSSVWKNLLLAGPDAYADQLNEPLNAELLANPKRAADALAQLVLQHREAFWRRELQEVSTPTDSSKNISPDQTECSEQLTSVLEGFELYRDWVTDDVIRLHAGDPMFLSRCGRREWGKMYSTGQAGHLIFGPYIFLQAGFYEVRVKGTFSGAPGPNPNIEIAKSGGNHLLARMDLYNTSFNESTDRILSFILDADCHDLEIRVWVEACNKVTLNLIEIFKI